MAWQAHPESVSQVMQLLHDSQLVGTHNALHGQIIERLEELKKAPEFGQYLMFVLTEMKREPENVRVMAGLLLKNILQQKYNDLPAHVKIFIQQSCLQNLNDSAPFVRNTIGTIICTVTVQGQLSTWQAIDERTHQPYNALVTRIIALLDIQDVPTLQSTLGMLQRLCEDVSHELSDDKFGCPAAKILPRILPLIRHPSSTIRTHALACINPFLLSSYIIHENCLEEFLQQLYGCLNDTCTAVRLHVCQAFMYLLESNPEDLLAHIQHIFSYMLHCLQDQDDTVKMQAAEFWHAFVQLTFAQDQLAAHLSNLIPVLLHHMVYPQEDIERLSSSENDAHISDRQQDLKPRFHNSNQNIHGSSSSLSADNQLNSDKNSDEDEDEEEDDDDNDNDDEEEWTLRRCCASALDQLSVVYQDSLTSLFLQHLSMIFQSTTHWPTIESGILALGAIADGNANVITHFLPFLMSKLTDPIAAVRTTTCWTVSRYANQCLQHHANYLFILIELMRDQSKKVQKAACNALSITIESVTNKEDEGLKNVLLSSLPTLLPCIHFCLTFYQAKNQNDLYDMIAALAPIASTSPSLPHFEQWILPILTERYLQLSTHDLFPIMEALAAIVAAFKYPAAIHLVPKAMHILTTMLSMSEESEDYDSDFITVGLDFLDAIVESQCPMDLQPFVGEILVSCMKKINCDIRQSAYALLGDLAKYGYQQAIVPHIHSIVNTMQFHLKPFEEVNVTNNAIWALGEIMLKSTDDQFIVMLENQYHLAQRMTQLSSQPYLSVLLKENLAIALGRMAFKMPSLLIGHLIHILPQWSDALRASSTNDEKDIAVRGVLTALRSVKEVNVIMHGLEKLIVMLALYKEPSQDQRQFISEFLAHLKVEFPQDWHKIINHVNPDIREKLLINFSV